MASAPRADLLWLRSLRERAAQSLFLIPALMVLMSAAIALGVDFASGGVPTRLLPAALEIGSSAARTLLSTIAGATITTVGVVFSVVVVSVQLASGQFSPRIIGNFFDDIRSKLTVGALAATFTYSVLALFSLGRTSPGDVPVVAVGLDVVFGLASILSIVSFLNHSARRLYVGSLAERVMRDTLSLIDRLDEQGASRRSLEEVAVGERPDNALGVSPARSGWLQQLSIESLAALLGAHRVLVIETRVGAYVIADIPLISVWPPPSDPDAFVAAARRAVVIGAERTMQQDLDFGLRQLSDVALRALSPSINDPHTAIEIVLRQGAILRRLLEVRLSPRAFECGGVTVFAPHELQYGDYLDHAFDDVRQVARTQPSVVRAVVTTCLALARAAEEAGRMAAGRPRPARPSSCWRPWSRATCWRKMWSRSASSSTIDLAADVTSRLTGCRSRAG